jgi:hypothetical protein
MYDSNVFSSISRSDDDPNVFLVNDFQDPLQVCYHILVLFSQKKKTLKAQLTALNSYHFKEFVGIPAKLLYSRKSFFG